MDDLKRRDDTIQDQSSAAGAGTDPLLRIAGIIPESVVDGPGIRYTVFVQGCPHHCRGCHNPDTHDFNGGSEVPISRIAEELDRDPLLTGVTFSGGEPLCQTRALARLAEEVRKRGLDLMIYTGYTYEALLARQGEDPDLDRLLQLADKLVDGPFILEQRDLTLQFRGSRNQRVIDLNRTRETGILTEYTEDKWNVFGL